MAAEADNALGIVGVYPDGIKLMALKFLDSKGDGNLADALSAMDYAVKNGAQVGSDRCRGWITYVFEVA
jgi:hypothetical protein